MNWEKVNVWEQEVIIPTYGIGEPDKNPMFLEKRVYQGSSGKVYPHSVVDKIYDEKEDKKYKAVFLENQYLKIMVLPELGGRIQRATDKTNGYDFVYYNHVIKPALVGLAGPWISGGIEFNWPQHHRPSTYDEVEYRFTENKDGSATIWVNEIENMFRTKGTAGFTLYPDKAYLEINARLYNRTDTPQTFLWWANPAIPVNDNTQSVFPPDVHAVMDHGKRAVSNFPIATGTYYKMDYSKGVDISRYKNIPVPTSYMAYHSDYDFVGGYDYEKEAGILHIANHHISPGKKQWTWGCGEFGKAWDRNLTDEDGPYIELMTGCFTDNQPDFTWLMPYEEKVFTQYFMPYKGVGMIQNATRDAAVRLEIKGRCAKVHVYTTGEYHQAAIRVCRADGEEILCFEETANLTPAASYVGEFGISLGACESDYKVQVVDRDGKELVSSKLPVEKLKKIPEPAKEAPLPQEVKSNEDLFLYGLHLEQYRHATYEPQDYYEEGLRRDSDDLRINNAYGKLLMRRGKLVESEKYFEKAVEKLLRSNPNPYDGEPLYNLGLCLKYLGRYEESYEAFYKATWNGAWQDSGFYQLACLDCMRGEYESALIHIDRSLVRNLHHMKARNLKTAILRKLGREEEARKLAEETLGIDCMDANSRNELIFLAEASKIQTEAESGREMQARVLHQNHNTYIELAIDYREAGLYEEAKAVLLQYTAQKDPKEVYPLVYYYLAELAVIMAQDEQARSYVEAGESTSSDYCFPHRLEDMLVLETAKRLCPNLAKAWYYVGNLWYDKKQYEDAVTNWEEAERLDDTFPTVHRNLALAYYNKKKDTKRAVKELEKAYFLNDKDARVLMELDQLYKKINKSSSERKAFLEAHMEVTKERDDLYLEYIALENALANYEKALDMLEKRTFHPWEGGEGKVPAQYILAHVEVAKAAIANCDYDKARKLLQKAAGEYPYHFGEGKLQGAQENNIYYYLGLSFKGLQEMEKAMECFERAAAGLAEPAGMMYYNDQPPEMIFYQGAALLQLGRVEEAHGRFHKLIDYGKKHIFDEPRIDYFAVSLPDLQIFEEDLEIRNKVHCNFMMALGYLGKGDARAEECFEEVLRLQPTHQGAAMHRRMVL